MSLENISKIVSNEAAVLRKYQVQDCGDCAFLTKNGQYESGEQVSHFCGLIEEDDNMPKIMLIGTQGRKNVASFIDGDGNSTSKFAYRKVPDSCPLWDYMAENAHRLVDKRR